MISLILICIAAFLNAVMDTLQFHFFISKFKNLDMKFWNPESSWKVDPLPGTKYKPDAWHLSKSLCIIMLCMAVVFYTPLLGKAYDFILAGVLWNLVFNLSYNKFLKA